MNLTPFSNYHANLRQDDATEAAGLGGDEEHHADAGLQHQVGPVGGIQAQRVGHRRPAQDPASNWGDTAGFRHGWVGF